MGIQDMKEYTRLCLLGAESIPERKAMLQTKRKQISELIHSLEDTLRYIDAKDKCYDDVLAGKREYFSNLLPCSCS